MGIQSASSSRDSSGTINIRNLVYRLVHAIINTLLEVTSRYDRFDIQKHMI